MEPKQEKQERRHGFAAMDPDKQRAVASSGGKAAHAMHKAHEFGSEEAKAAGRKGGVRVSRDRDHMAAIGKKGGASVSQNRDHMAAIGRRGGKAVSEDRGHMAAIGRKGGSSRAPAEPPAAPETAQPNPANEGADERNVA